MCVRLSVYVCVCYSVTTLSTFLTQSCFSFFTQYFGDQHLMHHLPSHLKYPGVLTSCNSPLPKLQLECHNISYIIKYSKSKYQCDFIGA